MASPCSIVAQMFPLLHFIPLVASVVQIVDGQEPFNPALNILTERVARMENQSIAFYSSILPRPSNKVLDGAFNNGDEDKSDIPTEYERNLHVRISNNSIHILGLLAAVGGLATTVKKLDEKISRLEQTTEANQISNHTALQVSLFNKTNSRLDRLDTNLPTMAGLLENLSVQVGNIERKLESEQSTFASLLSNSMDVTLVKLEGILAACDTTKNLTTSNSVTLSLLESGLETLMIGQKNLSSSLEYIVNVTQEEKLVSVPVESVVPFDCGGIIDDSFSGIIDFEAPYTLPYPKSCVWTVRVGVYQYIAITLVEENFAASKSKIRVMPLWGLFRNPYNGSSSSLGQREWNIGSEGASNSFEYPMALVEFIVQANASTRAKFIISFLGTGSPNHLNSGNTFAHSLHQEENGTILCKNRNKWHYQSFVIIPNVPYAKKVTLIQGNLNMKFCANCTCDRMRIWSIGSQSLIGSDDHGRSICGGATNFYTASDDVGFIIAYHSNAETTGNLSITYRTRDKKVRD